MFVLMNVYEMQQVNDYAEYDSPKNAFSKDCHYHHKFGYVELTFEIVAQFDTVLKLFLANVKNS